MIEMLIPWETQNLQATQWQLHRSTEHYLCMCLRWWHSRLSYEIGCTPYNKSTTCSVRILVYTHLTGVCICRINYISTKKNTVRRLANLTEFVVWNGILLIITWLWCFFPGFDRFIPGFDRFIPGFDRFIPATIPVTGTLPLLQWKTYLAKKCIF